MIGAVAGQLAVRRLPGAPLAWIASGATAGASHRRALRGCSAVLSRVALPSPAATLLGALFVAWAALDLAEIVPAPTSTIGSIAIWPLRFSHRPARHRRRRRDASRSVCARRWPLRRIRRAAHGARGSAAVRGDRAGPPHGDRAPPPARAGPPAREAVGAPQTSRSTPARLAAGLGGSAPLPSRSPRAPRAARRRRRVVRACDVGGHHSSCHRGGTGPLRRGDSTRSNPSPSRSISPTCRARCRSTPATSSSVISRAARS